MRSILDFLKKEIGIIKSRMNYFGIKSYHLLSILFLEIIGWTFIVLIGYKTFNCN